MAQRQTHTPTKSPSRSKPSVHTMGTTPEYHAPWTSGARLVVLISRTRSVSCIKFGGLIHSPSPEMHIGSQQPPRSTEPLPSDAVFNTNQALRLLPRLLLSVDEIGSYSSADLRSIDAYFCEERQRMHRHAHVLLPMSTTQLQPVRAHRTGRDVEEAIHAHSTGRHV